MARVARRATSRRSRPRRARSTARTWRRAARWAASAPSASPDGATVLTHCNAGALATGGYGTALGVIRAAREQGKRVRVVACETRPVLQGARLTAWELARDGFDVTLVTDSMVAQLMRRGGVDLVVVGADRIARSGDVANKIGTYGVACLAQRARRAVLRRRALEHRGHGVRRRRGHPHRAAERARGPLPRRRARVAPEGDRAPTTRPSTSRPRASSAPSSPSGARRARRASRAAALARARARQRRDVDDGAARPLRPQARLAQGPRARAASATTR